MADRTAVLVTGSRDWRDPAPIHERLSLYPPGTILLHGDCGRYEESDDIVTTAPVVIGADKIAGAYGRCRAHFIVWALPYFSDLGKRGGPARNAALVDVLGALWSAGFKCAVEAFPIGASVGTRGCVEIARRRFAVGTSMRPILIHVEEGKTNV